MKRLNLVALFLLGIISGFGQNNIVRMSENKIWNRSQLIPIPRNVDGVNNFYFDASDGWMMINEPQGDIIKLLSNHIGWKPMTKEMTARTNLERGHATRLFKRNFNFPNSFKGQRVIIRFEGVAHAAKLYVNGQFVREHWGSFSAWTADITDYIKDNKAIVGIYTDERRNGLAAYTNGCAFEPLFISGIQYGVSCYAVPQNYIVRANQDVIFDSEYKNAKLRIYMNIAQNAHAKENYLKVEIKSPDGKIVQSNPSTFIIPENMSDFYVESTVANPIKWDAEHPELYDMEISLYSNRKKVETVSHKIGFRQVELRGRNLFVNGQEVKFRGIWGGNDVKQLHNLNINHIRKNWATNSFLDSCDMLGMYVLDEIPTTFIRNNISNDPESAKHWLEMMADMMERDYSHPSVVMWSHGNESSPGTTTLKVHKFIKEEDPQRPDMFSWAQDIPVWNELPYDIYSFHYPDVMKGPKTLSEYQSSVFNSESQIIKRVPQPAIPVIADEFAHVPFGEIVNKDPNIRNFWGESIKLFWDYMYNTNGSLGGDQFGVFTGLETHINAPEEWLLRKAYSPICIKDEYLNLPENGKISFRVQNRFCHTNLNEIKIKWQVGTKSDSILCPSIAPSDYGIISLPVEKVKRGDIIEMAFLRKDGFQIDEYALPIGSESLSMPSFSGGAPMLKENENDIVVSGDRFKIEINKQTGQISSGSYDNKTIITGGPQLHIGGIKESLPEWSCKSISASIDHNLAVVKLEGNYADCKVNFVLQIDDKGLIETQYTVNNFNFEPLPAHELPWNDQHSGGFSEIGIKYDLTSDIDCLVWDRKALWSVYPQNHIGANKGIAFKTAKTNPHDWGTFTSDHGTYMTMKIKEQPYTNNFRATKEYIRRATAFASNKGCGLQVFSPMSDAIRMQPSLRGDNNIEMLINNQWNYPTLGGGNYMKRPLYVFEKSLTGVVHMRFVNE